MPRPQKKTQRKGITAMKRKLGLSSCGKALTKALFEQYAENGIDYMEISCESALYDSLDLPLLQSWAKEYGVVIRSLHLPFYPFEIYDISSLDENVRQAAIMSHTRLIERAAKSGIKIFVIHPSGEPIADSNRKRKIELTKNSLSVLADVCERLDVTLAVEDLPRTCLGNRSDELLYLVEDKRLKVCFDTNHLLGEDIEHFILAVGDRFISTHVSDYDTINERHWLPGEGVIDWMRLIGALDKVGYCGPILYEVHFKAPNTIIRERDLTCKDIRANFDTLIGGKIPEPFGKANV